MKKILTLILLLIVAVPVFYFGWTQIKVNNNSVGIIQTKMKGIKSDIVYPGQFSWHWDFLIPENAKLVTFDMKPYNTTKNISGQFQTKNDSGEITTTDYYFNYTLSLTYSAEALYNLMVENRITNNEDLKEYLNNAATSICQTATAYFLNKASKDPTFNPQSLKRDELVKAADPYKDFPDVDLTVFAISDFKLPYLSQN